jgi:translation initiation factor IF-1
MIDCNIINYIYTPRSRISSPPLSSPPPPWRLKMPRSAPSKHSVQSQARNKERTIAAVELEAGVEFGRVVRNLGGRNLLVLNQEHRESLAHIPGALAHRSSTPIVVGSIVIIIPRSYEARSNGEQRYDIFAVVQDKKDIRNAVKKGRIPEWMLNDSGSEIKNDIIEFDHHEDAGDGDRDGDNSESIDIEIDKI